MSSGKLYPNHSELSHYIDLPASHTSVTVKSSLSSMIIFMRKSPLDNIKSPFSQTKEFT